MNYRSKDYERISGILLMRLGIKDMQIVERQSLLERIRSASRDHVPWGGSQKAITDLLAIVNDSRAKKGMERMALADLETALKLYLGGNRSDPRVEELNDALCNLRELRLGVNKFPMAEGLRRTG
ncbi:MAG: hypothetical protein U0R44_06545 [Candidatus Micrarchaeia archaeon]